MFKRVWCLLLSLLLIYMSAAFAENTSGQEGSANPFLQQMNGKRVGVQTGTISGEVAVKILPDIQLQYYNSQTDLLTALRGDKIDAWCTDEPILRFAVIENPDLQMQYEMLDSSFLAAVFPKTEKGQTLRDRYSAFVDGLWADGTMKEIDGAWFGTDEEKRTILDYESLPDTNGTLLMAVDPSMLPFAYVKENRVVGYDVDIAARFCQANGYRLKVITMSFDGVLPSVQTGKADFAACGITITEERAESILFSSQTYRSGTALGVLRERDAAQTGGTDQTKDTAGGITSLDELAGKRVGVLSGTICDRLSQERIPNVQIQYYNSQTDALIALQTGKVQGWCSDEPIARYMTLNIPEMVILQETMAPSELGAVFPKTEKGQALRDQYSAFVEGLWADGTMAEIDAVWFGTDEDKRTVIDYTALPDTNGTLRMAADATIPPFTFVKDGRVMGYDIDIAARFCQAYGYRLEVEQMSFDGTLAAVQTGKCDFAACCITITEERAESMLFSSPNYHGGIAMTVLKGQAQAAGTQEDSSFMQGVVASFEKTFLREDRWKLFADGVLTTLLITVLSILFGTALGFLIFMLCRNGNVIANGITRFFMWLIQGMPMVVLLMILYYIVFGNVAISGVAVAVIGFTLTFGASVFSLLKMGVGTIDQGQYEASYALGYSNRRTFFRIILPQAVPRILPAYKGEIVSLIKATAIVGYIAVQDLTKMGDIVRSRTYEAFFPLIAITVIYFLLEALLLFLINKIQIRMNPRKRKPAKILKGVNFHD